MMVAWTNGDNSGCEKWWNSGFILNAELTWSADKLNVVCEISQNDSEDFNLSISMMKVLFPEIRKTAKEAGLGGQ